MQYLNVMIYGEPGAGKTYLAATAQDHEATAPILFLDVEGGVTTLRKRKNVDVVPVRTMKKLEEVYAMVANDKSGHYKTVVIDSLTEMQKLDMTTVMREQHNKKPDTTDIDVPSQREWGKSGARIRRTVQAFRDLPMNTIMTALMATERDETTNVTSYFPSLPGKLRGEIPGYFDIVGFLTSNEERVNGTSTIVRTLQVVKTKRVVAKDRTAALGDLLTSPSIPLMWEMIHEDS